MSDIERELNFQDVWICQGSCLANFLEIAIAIHDVFYLSISLCSSLHFIFEAGVSA